MENFAALSIAINNTEVTTLYGAMKYGKVIGSFPQYPEANAVFVFQSFFVNRLTFDVKQKCCDVL